MKKPRNYNKKKIWTRIGASALIFSLVVALFQMIGPLETSAKEYESLSGIEEIKGEVLAEGRTYQILEIVPVKNTGSIGYYIPGEEPIGWQEEVAAKILAGNEAGAKTYMEGKLNTLKSANLLSTPIAGDPEGGNTPLSTTESGYQKFYPWEVYSVNSQEILFGEGVVKEENLALSFTPKNGGAFQQIASTYELVVDGTGDYNQQMDEVLYGQQSGDNYYYYKMNFTDQLWLDGTAPEQYWKQGEVTEPLVNIPDEGLVELLGGKLVFKKGEEGQSNEFFGEFPSTVEELEQGSFVFDLGDTYYIGEIAEAPSKTYLEDKPYAVEIDVFVPKKGEDKGYFDAVDAKYQYVGEGLGNYEIATHVSGETNTVVYESVFVDPGFVNNNWFRSDTFDDESAEFIQNFPIEVNSVLPTEVTQEMVENADLIMITAGYDVATERKLTWNYYGENDITETQLEWIEVAVSGTNPESGGIATPLFLDGTLKLAGTASIGDFVGKKMEGLSLSTDGVKQSTLVLGDKNILTSAYRDELRDDYEAVGNPFYEVYEEIIDDNFLREVSGAVKLPTEVSIANSLRHIINYPYRRPDAEKTAINVLQLQPIQEGTTKVSADEITADDVLEWLPESTKIEKENITINTMAITEFIGKIEEITEVYDMVYIGASNEGFKLSGDKPNYVDNTMDGLYYTSIGDTVSYKANISGLLNREYAPEAGMQEVTLYDQTSEDPKDDVYKLQSDSSKFISRFSAFDLTPRKYQELIEFANSGFPIIVDNKLVNAPEEEKPEELVDVKIKQELGLNGYIQMEIDGLKESDYLPYAFTYQWYQKTSDSEAPIEGATSRGYETKVSGEYWCEVTVWENGVEKSSATSNRMEVSESALSVRQEVATTYPAGYVEKDKFSPVRTIDVMEAATQGTPYTMSSELNYELTEGYTLKEIWWYSHTGSYNKLTDAKVKEYLGPDGEIEHGAVKYAMVSSKLISSGAIHGYVSTIVVTDPEGNELRFVSWRRGINPAAGSGSNRGPYIAGNQSGTGDYAPTSYEFDVSQSYEKGAEGITVIAEPSLAERGTTNKVEIGATYNYQWYKKSGNEWSAVEGATQASLAIEAAEEKLGDYICHVTIGEDSVYTKYSSNKAEPVDGSLVTEVFKVDKGLNAIDKSGSTQITIPAIPAVKMSVNEETVDNSSYMYQMLNETKGFPNVMSVATAEEQKFVVEQYLNLSSPDINFEGEGEYNGRPEEYVGTDVSSLNKSLIDDQLLSFGFSIDNPTDPTALTTTYEVKLYIDQNADGKYEKSELIPDLDAYQSGGTGVKGAKIGSDKLLADQYYVIERKLPNTFYGAIPWKLEIVKTADDTVHDSEMGITYSEPSQMIAINVLQIAGKTATGGVQKLPSAYDVYFKQLREAGVYDIKVTTVTITDLNEMSTEDPTGASVYEKLDEYDMILMGFQESYGRLDSDDGFTRIVSEQINKYIDSGKATLFSHDNVSNENVPAATYPKSNGGMQTINPVYYSSYYLTLLNRGRAGQDPYGVVSQEFGFSEYSYVANANVEGTRYVADEYNGMNAVVEEQIKEAGYGIAYKPNSNREEYVGETQAYNNYSLSSHSQLSTKQTQTNVGYTTTSGQNFATTNQVSQVNKGAVTSYPFDVNVGEFANSDTVGDVLDIAMTHHQWYQLNMNTEEIVVWYCLTDDGSNGGNTFSNSYNDVVNGFYIYNIGNVTYTGAGHNVDSIATHDNEVRLFINTMIAAYRATTAKPDPAFVDGNGSEIKNYYVAAELKNPEEGYGEIILNSDDATAGRELEFMVEDANFVAEKDIKIQLYYESAVFESGKSYYLEDGEMKLATGNVAGRKHYIVITQEELKLIKAIDATSVTGANSIESGELYTYYLSDAILKSLNASNNIELYLEATTTFEDEENPGEQIVLTGLSEPLEISKLGLQNLN